MCPPLGDESLSWLIAEQEYSMPTSTMLKSDDHQKDTETWLNPEHFRQIPDYSAQRQLHNLAGKKLHTLNAIVAGQWMEILRNCYDKE